MICSALFCYLALPAQDWEKAGPDWLGANYTKREVMVPMRDGVSLYTAVYEPVGREEPAPVIICRTPYSLKPYGKADGIRKPYSGGIRDEFLNYAADKYVIVFQNVVFVYEVIIRRSIIVQLIIVPVIPPVALRTKRRDFLT